MKIAAISDTHHRYGEKWGLRIPPVDLLVHAGDFTLRGTPEEFAAFNNWLGRQPSRLNLICAGNHEWLAEKNLGLARAILTNGKLLVDERYEVDGLRLYFSPWQPWYCDWAFNLPRGGSELERRWAAIPDDTDMLVTHGPPWGLGDKVPRYRSSASGGPDIPNGYEHVGCALLKNRVGQVRPRWHVFGHIHAAYGIHRTIEAEKGEPGKHTAFVNAAICNEHYEHINPVVVIDTETGVIEQVPCVEAK